MKRFMLAIAIVCVLSVSALAGDVSSPGISPPAPGETHTPPGETATPPGLSETPPGVLATIILTIITWPR